MILHTNQPIQAFVIAFETPNGPRGAKAGSQEDVQALLDAMKEELDEDKRVSGCFPEVFDG